MAYINTLKKNIKVVDTFNTPLAWANVLTAQGKGTITDDEGNAVVEALTGNQQIVISFMGFKSKTMPFNQLPGKVILEPDVNELDPVIITAPKKKESTSWATYAGLAIGAIGLFATLNGNDEPQKVIPVKPTARKINL